MNKYDYLKGVESNARTYATTFARVFDGARGIKVWDSDGEEIIDCLMCAGALPLGHNHPEVQEEVLGFIKSNRIQQALDLSTPAKYEFVRELLSLLPPTVANGARIHFCAPSGSDAIEAAMKLARLSTGRRAIVAFHGAYHGMTSGALAAMGDVALKTRLGIDTRDVYFAPYPDRTHCPFGTDGTDTDRLTANYLRTLLSDPESGIPVPAAVIVEVVQGEGGCVPASESWLKTVRDVTRELGILLVVDEVQTGLGRTGRMFAFEHASIEPDIVVLSKAIGGGYPLAAIVYSSVLDTWPPGTHAGTFRGNQIAMIAGRVTMNVIRRDRLDVRAAEMGKLLQQGLTETAKRHSMLSSVRGRGLMIGVEVSTGARGDRPQPKDGLVARRIKAAALESGLLIETGGRHGSVLRFLPPLTLDRSDLGQIVDRFDTAVRRATLEL